MHIVLKERRLLICPTIHTRCLVSKSFFTSKLFLVKEIIGYSSAGNWGEENTLPVRSLKNHPISSKYGVSLTSALQQEVKTS